MGLRPIGVVLVFAGTIAAAIATGANGATGGEVAAVRDALEGAEETFDRAALLRAGEQLERLARQPDAPPLVSYLQGRAYLDLVTWHQCQASLVDALHYAELAVVVGQTAVERNRQHSDSHRVLGEAYGRLIALRRGLAGLLYGRRSQQELALALRLDPLNARAHLAMGIVKLRSPGLVGGDPDLALHAFEKAVALAPESWEPHAWLGIAQRERGEADAARAALERALALSPNNEWVKAELEVVGGRR